MSYFVTGATGFIGRYLVSNLLKRKGNVHVLPLGKKIYEAVGRANIKMIEDFWTIYSDLTFENVKKAINKEQDVISWITDFSTNLKITFENIKKMKSITVFINTSQTNSSLIFD